MNINPRPKPAIRPRVTNFTTVLDYEMNYYDEALNLALALSRLEELSGQPLTD